MDPQEGQERDRGIRYLTKRIRLMPAAIGLTLLAIFLPLINESSNQKQAHTPTMLCSYFNLLFWFVFSVLTYKVSPSPSNPREGGYTAIKMWLHLCVFSLVTLSFTLSLMMRMNKGVTITTLVVAAVFVAHRAWQCAERELDADVATYRGREEVIHHLIELSTMTTTMVLGAWFSSDFFYLQNYPEQDHQAWLLPSQYLAFFISVAASLTLVKSVARREKQPLWEIVVLMCVLYAGLVVLALVIGASRVDRYRWYTPLALVPEAVALAVWFALWVKHNLPWGGRQHQQRDRDQDDDEQKNPPPHEAVAVGAFAVVMMLVSYSVRNVARALSTLYDEVFVIFITGAGVAALGWRMLTRPPMPALVPGVQAAGTILAWSAVCLAVLSLLMLFGIIVRLIW